MNYSVLGKTGLQVSRLSFGAIKLPEVDQKTATSILNLALDMGINFVDTARKYRDSEQKIGKALKHRRDEFYLATKTAALDQKSFWEDLETSLQQLNMEKIDLYQFHSISNWKKYEQLLSPNGAYNEAITAKEKGIIDHIGITVHRDLRVMEEAIKSGLFETIMVSYNAVDQELTEKDILPLAKKHNVGIIVMKPLGGGGLVTPNLAGDKKDEIVEGALRYVLANDCVSVAIPGMRSEKEVRENIATEQMSPLSDGEMKQLFLEMGGTVENLRYNQQCLQCGYCMPCPQGIDIPKILSALNMAENYPQDFKEQARQLYQEIEIKADVCVKCKQCEDRCPAGLQIAERMQETKLVLA